MLHDVIFSLPDGRDAIVRLDTTLEKNEIRVGSLGALDQFVADAKDRAPGRKSPTHSRRIIRLSHQQVLNAREWLDKNLALLPKEEQKVMQFFFPPKEKGMVSSKGLEGINNVLGMGPEPARNIRNRILRKAGILT